MSPRVRRVSWVGVMLLGFVVGLTHSRRSPPEGVTVIPSVVNVNHAASRAIARSPFAAAVGTRALRPAP